MSPSETPSICIGCGKPVNQNGDCTNVNCRMAAEQATKASTNQTRKAAVPAPRAFARSGRVD